MRLNILEQGSSGIYNSTCYAKLYERKSDVRKMNIITRIINHTVSREFSNFTIVEECINIYICFVRYDGCESQRTYTK